MDESKKDTIKLEDEKIKEISKKISEQKGGFFDSLLKKNSGPSNPNIENVPTPNTSVPITQEQERPDQSKPGIVIKNLRTFQGDLADAIQDKNASLLSITLAERKRHDERKTQEPKPKITPRTKKNFLSLAVSIFLVIIGIGAISTILYFKKTSPEPIITAPEEPAIISYKAKKTYLAGDFDKNKFAEIISSIRSSWQAGSGDIFFIELLKSDEPEPVYLDTQIFFNSLKTRAPSSLIRAMGDEFMLGLSRTRDNSDTFILIEIDSFEHAFPGMLEWEKTIYNDIGILFSKKVLPITSNLQEGSTGTTTLVNFENEIEDKFEDLTIKNKDIRILKNTRGETVLLYSFLTPKLVLITESQMTLENMLNKVSTPAIR